MEDFSRDVSVLSSLEATLLRRGYLVDQPWSEGPMSSGRMSVAGRVAHIRLTADRGQWFVDVRPATGSAKWFDLEQWSVCLGQPASFHTTRQSFETADVAAALAASWRLQPQASWLERNLDDIEAACTAGDRSAALDCLRRTGGRD